MQTQPNVEHRGPGFITLWQARGQSIACGRGVPVAHLCITIRAEWDWNRNAPIAALSDWIFPPIDSARSPLAYAGCYGESHFECDAYGEHAAQILTAIMRLRPDRVSCYSHNR